MKNETARREIESLDYYLQNHTDDYSEESHTAMLMAIKALEQQKPIEKFESVKDHIYKLAGDYKCWDNRLTDDEALELCHILEQQPSDDVMAIHTQGLDEGVRCAMCTNSFKSNRGCDGGCVVNEDMYKEVMNTIRNHIAPSVTPTRKKGKWIKVTETEFGIGYKCSECGRFVLTESIDGRKLKDYPYCHCGAEMESE